MDYTQLAELDGDSIEDSVQHIKNNFDGKFSSDDALNYLYTLRDIINNKIYQNLK